jgi:inward rectifier potassium channel
MVARGSRGRRTRRKIKVRHDQFGLAKMGAKRFDFHDPYYLAVSLRWPIFVLAVVTVWVTINLIFAALYVLEPGGVTNTRPGSFSDVFFFSIETMATVGYGVMAPSTLYAHTVSAVEIVTGMAFTAIVTGLLFVRFSRPRARVMFASDAVITPYNHYPTLMVRVANARLTPMTGATAQLHVLLGERTSEGHFYRRITELPLLLSELPLFVMPWTVMHRIDETSPLKDVTPDKIATRDFRLFVTIEAHDPVLATHIHDIKDYDPAHVRWGMHYADAVILEDDGRVTADLSRISLLEADGAQDQHTGHRGSGGLGP